MLSNQILHKTAQDIREITGFDCAIWDMQGFCLVRTNETLTGYEIQIQDFRDDEEEPEEIILDEMGMFRIYEDSDPVYVLMLHGTADGMELAGRMGASQLRNLLYVYKERMDKNRFIQNLLLDNLLLVDIYNQAKKMRIPVELKRVVFVIEPKNEGDVLVQETLKGLYATGTKDFVTAIDEKHIILVKSLQSTDSYPQVEQIAKELVTTLNMEAMVSVRAAYGTIVEELKDVSRSYKEADMALEVGRVFYTEKKILAYNELGIGRLIHQLPASLCEMFLNEVFEDGKADIFEEEELTTVYTFFDNNLNISETARRLYVHRNTLVYRLEKIQKKTGLDVRVFDDALTFKIAMMVADHMKYVKE